MARVEFLVEFEGDLATEHKLPAYEAGDSLTGIAKTILIPTNYLFEGRVRRRRFEEVPFQLNLVAQRRGSFQSIYELLYDPLVATSAGVAIGITANLLTDFVKTIAKRAVGQGGSDRIQQLEAEGRLNAGDLAALVDAVEPSVKQSHRTIGAGAQVINIVGDGNSVTFNSETKRYVSDTVRNDEVRVRSFSVASLNSNTGYGRLFDAEEGRTIPFQLPTGIDGRSVAALLSSFNRYARRRWMGNDEASLVAVRYQTLDSVDGRVKKILPLAARDTMEEL
ncbi:DUF7946 domain-containing protein [Henriciella mobilis]|uniref:Uncharacterized protein n=1 Tax=Henriciella mobilis TaxID=2305467 RepID=A0A399RNY4_9PROT|nr:hypothetical protein [Henriciella mobilis]RIJ32501.1 hypothetical protein D1223_01200 [Henriciella mobilis]